MLKLKKKLKQTTIGRNDRFEWESVNINKSTPEYPTIAPKSVRKGRR